MTSQTLIKVEKIGIGMGIIAIVIFGYLTISLFI